MERWAGEGNGERSKTLMPRKKGGGWNIIARGKGGGEGGVSDEWKKNIYIIYYKVMGWYSCILSISYSYSNQFCTPSH